MAKHDERNSEMSESIGTAYVQILPTTTGIGNKISTALAPQMNAVGTQSGSIIGSSLKHAIVGAGIGTALAGVFKTAISEGGKLQQSVGGIETLFKSSAGTIEKYASGAFKSAGLSANDYMETATTFAASLVSSVSGNTAKAAKTANMAITDMADNSNKMGTSMGSIQYAYQGFAKQNYTMLDNLKLGYGGTKTEMQRLLVDAGKLTGKKYDIKNLNDVYTAIHLIQGKLGITGTTAREAATTLTGSASMVKSAWSNLLGDMALGSNDAIKKDMSNLVNSGLTFLKNFLPMVKNVIIEGLTALSPSLGAIGKNMVSWFTGSILPAIQAVISFLGAHPVLTKIIIAATAFLAVGGKLIVFISSLITAGAALAPILGAISLPMIGIAAAIAAAVVVGILLVKNWSSIKAEAAKIWGAIESAIVTVVNAVVGTIKSVWGGIKSVVSSIFGGVKAVVSAVWGAIKEIFFTVLGGILAFVKLEIRGIVVAFNGLKTIVGVVKAVFETVKKVIMTPILWVVDHVKAAIEKIKGFFDITLAFKGIKLPHISISWKTSGSIATIAKKMGLPGLPDFGVKWYATGGVFNQPTVAGIGEAGAEAVVPLNTLWHKFDSLAENIANLNTNQPAGNTYYLGNIAYDDGSAVGNAVSELVRAAKVDNRK